MASISDSLDESKVYGINFANKTSVFYNVFKANDGEVSAELNRYRFAFDVQWFPIETQLLMSLFRTLIESTKSVLPLGLSDLLSAPSDDLPKFLEVFKSQDLRPGESLSLKCMATGTPLPMITWLLDDLPITELNGLRYGDYVTRDSNVISFVNISSVSTEHGGHWACMARSMGASVRYGANINVLGAPYVRLIPNMTLVAHQTIYLKCPVGGNYDEIQWEKNGVLLPDNHRQTLHTNGTLIVRELSRETDGGRYSCFAKYKGDIAKRDFYITVREKPVIEPFIVPSLVHTGQRLSITCTVIRGDPPLTIKWLYNDHMIGEESLTSSMIKVHHLTDYSSTLLFETLTKKQTEKPRWIIEPTDHIDLVEGNSVWVDFAARFRAKFRAETVARNQKAILVCEAVGERPITIEWNRDRQLIHTEHHSNRYAIKETVMNEGITSELVIESIDRSDSALYQCITSNAYGKDETSIQVIVQEPPDTPLDVKVDDITSRSARVSWAPPFTGNSRITKYHIYLKENPTELSQQKRNITIPGTETVWTISELLPNNVYSLNVAAVNSLGISQSSLSINFQTEEEVPSDPPTHIKAHSNSSNTLRISWKAFNSKGAGPPSEPIKDRPKTVTLNPIGVTAFSVDLEWIRAPNDDNSVSVMACNKVGCSDRHHIQLKTKGSTPQPPDKESLLATINSTFVIINLSAFSDNGCPLQHFQLKYRPKETTVWTLYSNFIHSSQKSLLIDGLSSNSWYYIQITAYSQAGSSQAEYNFLTRTTHNYNLNADINEEAVILSDYKTSVLLEFEVILPLTLSGIVVVAVTLLVCVVIHRRHPNDTFHSSNTSRMSNGKQNILNADNDNVNLCDMDKTATTGTANRNQMTAGAGEYQMSHNQQKCIYFPTPYATTQIDETLVEYVDNSGTIRKVSDCGGGGGGQYATVKRMTPKMHPKSDLHIYSYAVNSQRSAAKEDSEALITYLVEPMGGGNGGGPSYGGPAPTHCCTFVDNNQTKLSF
ncbi:unnamed protein product [Oppiella nova]|uniref:Uncharacterized protein n=1 Tax=Oppiella nova TaxID=334625 RepID=A0A7R9Q9S1_9ACAR|nr:unnamed protein product [Oppiella nova]CAG2161346.1 unnamed protein product [Oppiella nova]